MKFTSEKIWLMRYSLLLTFAIISYTLLHSCLNYPEQRVINLSSEQVDFIVNVTLDSSLDQSRDSIVHTYLFVSGYYNGVEKPESLPDEISDPMRILDPSLLRSYLTSYTYVRPSTFWLDGGLSYLEIVFWSWFGVLSSLLYHGTEAMRLSKFDPKELAVHYAKLFYTPLVTIVLILCIDWVIDGGDLDLRSIDYWLVVLSFVLGFYSRKSIDLLDRIKDLIFKSGKSNEQEGKTQPDDHEMSPIDKAIEVNIEEFEKLPNFLRAYPGIDYSKAEPQNCAFIELSDADDSKLKIPLGYKVGEFERTVPTVVLKNVKPSESTIGQGDAIANDNYLSYLGTIGCPVLDTDENLRLISCAHVLAGGVFDPTVYKGDLDAPEPVVDASAHRIGDFIYGFQNNQFDFGLCSVDDQASVDSCGLEPEPIDIGSLTGPTNLHFKGQVSAGSGFLIAKNQTERIVFDGNYHTLTGLIKVAHVNGESYRPISEKGDSGSILFTDQQRAVAMIVSSNDHFTFGFPIASIFSFYNLKIY